MILQDWANYFGVNPSSLVEKINRDNDFNKTVLFYINKRKKTA